MIRLMKKGRMAAKVIVVLTLLLSGVHLFQKKAEAAEFNLPFNTEVHGVLTKGITSNTYNLVINEAGRLTLDLTSYVDKNTYIQLLDNNNKKIWDTRTTGSSLNPAKLNKWVDLEPGKYFLKINGNDYWDENTGKYILKATFKKAGNNEIEPNNGVIEAQAITFNQLVTGFLSWNDTIDMYKITLKKPGRLGIDISSYVDSYTYIRLYDNNNKEIFSTNTEGSSKNPAKYMKTIDLEPGNYYLNINGDSLWDRNTGKYQLKTTFTAANSNETEPNNGIVEAQTLPFNKTITGFLSWNDTEDYYKISLPKKGKVTFTSVSYVESYTNFQLINNRNEVVVNNYATGSSKNPAKYSNTIVLEKGIYYFRVYSDLKSNTGKYTLNISSPVLLAPLTVDKVSDKSTVVKGKTAKNQEVVVKASGKVYKKKANSAGAYSIKIPKQKAGTKIAVSAKNKYGTKKVTITVLDRTAPKAPTIKKATSTFVEGKGEKAATVYVYKGSKLVGKATVSKKGTFKAKISKQKKGTSLVVYAKDKAGNKSVGRTVKVK